MTLLPYAPLESNRFELKIHRGVLDRIPHDFDREIIDSRMDVAIFRMPAGNQDQLALLDSIGFPWLVADTLVYYANDLKGHEPNDLRNSDLRFIVFTPGLDNAIDDLVADIFPRYANHYTSNPLLSRDLIPSYQEWARSYATDEDAGRYAWLVERHDAFIGFITCSFGDEGAEIVLNGVSPAQAGGGVYGDMVRFVQRYFKDRGCSVIKVSTQGNNHAVQKVWSREGFFLTESYFTIHVNSLLSASASKERVYLLNISSHEGVDARAALSAEIDSALAKCRVDGSLAQDASVLNARMKYLRPVRQNVRYEARIRFPVVDEEMGTYRVVVLVTDDHGEPCQYAHYELGNPK